MPVTVGSRHWSLTPGSQVGVSPTNPLSQGLFAVHLPMRWLLASMGSSTLLTPKYATRGLGSTGTSGSKSDSIPGFQSGPWSYYALYTPVSLTSRCIAIMCEAPGNATNDRILGLDAGGNFTAQLFDGANRIATSSTLAVAGVAYSMVVVADGSTISLWVNGLREASTSTPGGSGYGGYVTPELSLGEGNHSVNPNVGINVAMDGTLHIFAAWRRALTANEIATLYGAPFALLRRTW